MCSIATKKLNFSQNKFSFVHISVQHILYEYLGELFSSIVDCLLLNQLMVFTITIKTITIKIISRHVGTRSIQFCVNMY